MVHLRRFFFFLCFAFLSSFSLSFLHAQPVWEGYDSTFHAGALDIKLPEIARRVLLLDHGHYYGTPIQTIQNQYNDTSDRRGELWRRSGSEGFRVSFNPPEYLELAFSSRVVETYPGAGEEIRTSDFLVRNGTIDWLDPAKRLLKYIAMPYTGSDTLVVGKPRYLNPGLERGVTWPFSTLGIADSSRFARVAFAIWMDINELDSIGVGMGDTVAYVVLMRRYTGGQSGCRCGISERFDTLFITRGMYQNGDLINLEGYREVSALYHIDTLSPNPGGDFGWPSGGSLCATYCADLYGTLNPDRYANYATEGSDFHYEFWSAGVVPIRFLRGRVGKRLFDMMAEGTFDSYFQDRVDALTSWQPFDTIVWRVGTVDEPKWTFDFRPVGLMSAKIDHLLKDAGKNWQIWNNTYQDLQSFRLLSGDFDSVGTKIIQMFAPQPYGGQPIPVTYANPDSMDQEAFDHYYTEVYYNTLSDYRAYNGLMNQGFGKFRDYYLVPDTYIFSGIGGMVRAVDVARFRYTDIAASHPVYQNVQVHGALEHDPVNGYTGFGNSLPAPNSIIACSWLAMNCGSQGVIYSDFTFDGTMFGPLHYDWHVDRDSTGEYDIDGFMANLTDYEALQNPFHSEPKWKLPRMWVGFKSRIEAIRTVMRDLRAIDSIVGWKNLIYQKEQISVHDTGQSFSEIPLLDTALAKQAKRYDLDGNGDFIDSAAYDARDSTYLEITHLAPTAGDVSGSRDSRYYVITNRRIWPLDTMCYETDSSGNCIERGLGYIDARKPVVRFTNSTGLMADSFLVEHVGTSWSTTGAFGSLVELSWHLPGHGALYRITPLPRGVSHEGTAFNNAVRSENPSTDVDEKPVMAVVERDSSVVLRTFDTVTGWTGEVMVSDAADTVRVPAYGRRRAHNSLPAIATTRDASATLVVWQRVDTLNRGTVEGLWIPGPPTPGNLAAAVRLRLSPVRLLSQAWMMMTPSVVGLEEGWVVAYGAPRDAIEVVALRNDSVPSQANDLSLLKRVRASKIQFPARTPGFPTTTLTLDSTSMFPTLAYVPDTVPLLFTENPGRPVYLAWQQGGHDPVVTPQNPGPYIFSCRIDVEWNTGGRPKLYHVETDIEHVSQGLPGCSFRHPSIAADSTRIGVAFESRMLLLPGSVPGLTPLRNVDVITLRFRDSILNGSTAGARPWNTPAYYWGDSSTAWAYPSLTEFPAMSRASLNGFPQGGLAWFDQGDMRTQRFYRFGERAPAELPEGSFPTMTLSPSLKSSPMEKAGVLYRGSAPTAFDGVKGWGDTGTYYPSRLLTNRTGGAFDFGDVFSVIPSTGGIHSHFSLGGWTPLSGGEACDFVVVHGGILRDWPPDHEDDPFKDPPIGPGFFGSTEGGDSWIETTTETAELVPRTGVFTAGSGPVKIKRYIARTSNAVTWLNTFPYDTLMNSQPDVKVLTELVRASDGAVLWRDDTLSVRSMSTDEDGGLVPVPVDIYATPGTSVYIRLRPVTTMEMEYSLTGGYQFYEGYAAGGFTKVVSPRIENMESRDEAAAGLHLRVIPNPARERAEVRIRLAQSGRVRLSVYNSLGARVAVLPDLNAETAGEYSVEISLAHVRPGIYLLRGESEKEEAVVQFSVMK